MSRPEPNEIADLAAVIVAKSSKQMPGVSVLRGGFAAGFAEEGSHVHFEYFENPEKRIEPDPVFALFHPGKIGLLNADAAGKLRLSQVVELSDFADLRADRAFTAFMPA